MKQARMSKVLRIINEEVAERVKIVEARCSELVGIIHTQQQMIRAAKENSLKAMCSNEFVKKLSLFLEGEDPIGTTELSNRTKNVLDRIEFSVEFFKGSDRNGILKYRGLGRKAANEIQAYLSLLEKRELLSQLREAMLREEPDLIQALERVNTIREE